jgi:hypothetical protein
VECVVQSYNFDDCSGGFTSTAKAKTWECGKPSTGPKSDHTGGGSLWATRLGEQPAYCEDSFLESPGIDLSAQAGKQLRLRVWHWGDFRVCDPTKGLFGACQLACNPPFGIQVDSYSGGVLEVYSGGTWKVVTPLEGYGTSNQPLEVNGGSGDPNDGGTPPCQSSTLDEKTGFAAKGVNKAWVLSTFDISPHISSEFRFRLHFASAPKDECFPNTAGWYVDDVAIFYAGDCK